MANLEEQGCWCEPVSPEPWVKVSRSERRGDQSVPLAQQVIPEVHKSGLTRHRIEARGATSASSRREEFTESVSIQASESS
jgi:hypothetical protein